MLASAASGPVSIVAWAGFATLAVLLVSNGPLFVCMPLTDDVANWDLQAWIVLNGGVLYRDVWEPNLPGVGWMQMAIRSVLGWSSEALRLVDLAIFAITVVVLTRLVRRVSGSLAAQAWTAAALFLFYFSISEWNHFQRDVLALAPALLAVQIRTGLRERLPWRIGVRGIAEGGLWGVAVWIKPHVAIPAAACWLVSAWYLRRARVLLVDLAAVAAGGIGVGVAGLVWLDVSGAWPHLVAIYQDWILGYVGAGREGWTLAGLTNTALRFTPWLQLHLVAVPVALWGLVGLVRSPAGAAKRSADADRRLGWALLCAMYLAWLSQALLLQHQFDYVQTPPMVLALGLMGAAAPWLGGQRLARLAIVAFLLVAVLTSPVVDPRRLGTWWTCLTSGSTPQVKNRLALSSELDWESYAKVVAFLEPLGLGDGELTALTQRLVPLYRELEVLPPTPIVFLEAMEEYFPERRDDMRQALRASGQRFVVADLSALGVSRGDVEIWPPELGRYPPSFPVHLQGEFPWSQPVVFRAGSLVVLEVEEDRKGAVP